MRCAPRLALAGLLVACGESGGGTDPSAPARREAADGPQSAPSGAISAPGTHDDDPRGAAERADLDRLCAALDHDYIDGTLSDYYGEVKPETDWGRKTRADGNVADQPGRHLEAAAAEFTKATGETLPAACTKLFEQLDDLE